MAAVLTGVIASVPLILKAVELIEAFSAAYQTLKRVDAIASTTITPLAIQCEQEFRALLGMSHISAKDLYTAVSKFVTDVVPVIESTERELSQKLEDTRQAADEICILAKKDNLTVQKGFDNVKNALQTICEELCHTQASIVEDGELPLKDLENKIEELIKAIGPSPVPLSIIQRIVISIKEFIPLIQAKEAEFVHKHNHVAAVPIDPAAQSEDGILPINGDEDTAPTTPVPESIAHEPNYRDFVNTMIDEFNSILGYFKNSDVLSSAHKISISAVNTKDREEHVERLTKLKHQVEHKTKELVREKHEIEGLIKVFSSLSGKVCQLSKIWAKVYSDLMTLSKYLEDPQNDPANEDELLTRVKTEQGKYEETMVTLKSYEKHVQVVAEPKPL